MFSKIAACILFVLIIQRPVQAQTPGSKKKVSLYSISSAGLLSGSKGSALTLQTIAGIGVHRSFVGLGIGLDHYKFRSIPLFLDLRQEFGKGKRNLFLYGDIGYNYDCLTDKNKTDAGFFVPTDYKGGIYYDAGLGYKISFKGSDALLFSAGYSLKRLSNMVGTGNCPLAGPCYEQKQKYTYSLSRISLKAGWRF